MHTRAHDHAFMSHGCECTHTRYMSIAALQCERDNSKSSLYVCLYTLLALASTSSMLLCQLSQIFHRFTTHCAVCLDHEGNKLTSYRRRVGCACHVCLSHDEVLDQRCDHRKRVLFWIDHRDVHHPFVCSTNSDSVWSLSSLAVISMHTWFFPPIIANSRCNIPFTSVNL